MQLINATAMPAAFTLGIEPSGRERLVVVVKATYAIPRAGGVPALSEVQVPLVMADVFTGRPDASAPLYESEFAPRKAYCDVLLVGSAYAPGARPVTEVPIGLRVGNWSKRFAVVGDRFWSSGIGGIRATPAQPFVVKRIGYEVAFGGVDTHHPDPRKSAWFRENPVGRGFHKHLRSEWVDGAPLPNTQALEDPILAPDGKYAPMALGPLGRGWAQRARFAGTYDDRWLEDRYPFLPVDFDERYYQAAAPDQQIQKPEGPLNVVLVNLTEDGRRQFDLPVDPVPVAFFPRAGEPESVRPELDTIVIEPDEERFTLTWRATRALKKSVHEIAQVTVGRMSRGWWRAREGRKAHYRSLADLVRLASAE